MAHIEVHPDRVISPPLRWRELWLKEDWWAIWLGLGIVVVAYGLFVNGSSIRWLAVTPAKWSTLSQLGAHFAANYDRYIAQFLVWLAVFSIALTALGHKARNFIPSFVILYLLSVAIFALGQWDKAITYDLEPPLVALVVGLALSNVFGIPRWLDAGFRVEFYIKTGIVLLGATLPFTLILWAGPTAILQASIVSIVTFVVIYWVAVKLGLDKRLAATLGAGGAVCGVSAAIAIAGAVGAKKEDAPIAITVVIIWAVAMIFVLPFVAEYQNHHLLIDVRVMTQAAYRASARGRHHLVCCLSLLCERGKRSDLFWRWLFSVYLDPECAHVALMLLILDVDAAQGAVVAPEVLDEREQRCEILLLGRRVAYQHNHLAGVRLPIHFGDGSLDRAERILLPFAAAFGLNRAQERLQLRSRECQRLHVERLALATEHDDADARDGNELANSDREPRHPRFDVIHHEVHRLGAVDHEHDIEALMAQGIEIPWKGSATTTAAESWV